MTDSETRTVTALTNHALPKPDKKEKAKDALKKANRPIVPQAIAIPRNPAAIAVAQITPPVPATRDKTTKRMRKTRRLINKQISIYRLKKPPSCFKNPSYPSFTLSLVLTLTLPVGGRMNKWKRQQQIGIKKTKQQTE